MLPIHDAQYDEGPITQQQRHPCEYVANLRVSYDDSDPDQGFTEDAPEPWVAGQDGNYDQSDHDPRFCTDFHDAHMEVHKEFWDIIDSEHECYFCHNICTVMRCPSCDVQACSHCKNARS